MVRHKEDSFNQILKENPDEALDYLYANYYRFMCEQVYNLIKDRVVTEDIVQEILVDLWINRHNLVIDISLRAYLNRACRNRSINHLTRDKRYIDDDAGLDEIMDTGLDVEENIINQETALSIQNIIESLPVRCQLVFNLSRFENMTYKEIGKKLDISHKTVENQIGKALKILRYKLNNI